MWDSSRYYEKRRDALTVTQTSTSKPTPDTPGMFPPDRYGRRRQTRHRSRWMMTVLIIAGVAIMSLIAVKLYLEYGNDEFTPTVISDKTVTDTSMTVKFQVAKPDGAPATCTVEAFAYDNTQVGTAQVAVPAGTNVTVTYTLATTSRPYVAEIPACQPVQ
jgi:hypothetical protein